MKKTFITIAIISTLLAAMLAGCRAATPLPGVTAMQSPLPTLPYTSPSPAATFGGITPTSPGVTLPAVASPTVGITAGTGATP